MKVLICIALLVCGVTAFRTQSTGVKGRLLCGTKPAVGVNLKLFDEDNGPDPDDVLDQKTTDSDGNFLLTGSSMELTPIDPELRIFHDCNDQADPCQREWVIRIPAKYITNGPEVKEIMDLGVLNLEVELENESRSCAH
uniref:Transthyretin-like family protein n=1 Tax=Caenorhabditis tropicalis TaxID=1561998 RepID=A0A1I7TJ30_9PELO